MKEFNLGMITFTDNDIDQLIDGCIYESFIAEQPERFFPVHENKPLDEEQVEFYSTDSSMNFTNDFLKAKIVYEYYKHKHKHAVLLSDEGSEFGWCVLVKKRLP